MIEHATLKDFDLKQITLPSGRMYETPDGFKFPSVTTVLGKTADNSWLEEWKNRVGEEEALKTSKRATLRGTALHQLCEDWLNNKPSTPSMFDVEMFNQFKPILSQINLVYAIEKRLFSKKLKTAGTVDLCCKVFGGNYIVDWKTSGRKKTRDEIHSYFIQCAFYAYCFYEMYGIMVPNILIVMAVDGETKPLIFREKVSTWLPEFVKIRKQFQLSEGY